MASKSIQILLFLFLFSFLITDASTSILFLCSASNFTTNSTYESNLNQVLYTLPSAGWRTGFSLITQGHAPNQIFGRSFCLGNLDTTECKSCLLNGLEAIKANCPQSKRAGLWYDDCFLRYSDTNSTTSDEKSWLEQIIYSSTEDLPDLEKFQGLYTQLMGNLADRAANSSQMFKVDAANYTSSITIYGLVQCIRDLSPDECYTCLKQYISLVIPTFVYWGKQRFAILGFQCYIRTDVSPFFNLSLIDTTPSVMGPMLPPSLQPEPHSKEAKRSTASIVVLVVCPVGAFLLLIIVLVYLRTKMRAEGEYSNQEKELGRNGEFVLFDLGTLRAATGNFSEENKLGEGGFGIVYKGILANDQEIAVKRLSRNSQKGLEHIRNELALVAKLHHKNIVRMLGCCLDGPEKLLVYEYLCNTSLDKFLFDPVRRYELNWERRFKIIEGIGRGLHYLHEDSRLKIIHHDLKPSNILLDADMNPKLSDFGIAKLFDVDASQGNTSQIAGTYGYMAPEYVMNGVFSTKTDVFSYGILILEIVTGQTNSCCQDPLDEYLLTYVWRHWSQGVPLEVIDKSIIGHCPSQDLVRCIHVGLLCVKDDPSERPSVASVLLMLGNQSMTIPTPSAPTYVFQGVMTTASESNPRGLSTNAHRVVSTNKFSELEPR